MKSERDAVLFDIDGVLADFLTGFTTLGHQLMGTPITDTHAQPSWNGFPGITSDEAKKIWAHIITDVSFWYTLNPLVSAETFKAIRYLTCELPVYFVTARVGVEAKAQTEDWLESAGIDSPTVIISKYKGEVAKAVRAKACIDDKAGNASCVAWITEDQTQSYLIDRKYNQCPDGFLASSVQRVATVEDYLAEVER